MRVLLLLVPSLLLLACATTDDPPATGTARLGDGHLQVHGALRAMFQEGQTQAMVSLDSLTFTGS